MDILLKSHGHFRWLVLAALALAILVIGFAWIRNKPFGKLERIASSTLMALTGLQSLMGISLLLWFSFSDLPFMRHRWEHAFVMLVTLGAVHFPLKWKKAPDDLRLKNTFYTYLLIAVFLYLGVALLPKGWGN